jgi:pseudouridine-5'-phosphate glycosidase/pseudouridine kinase
MGTRSNAFRRCVIAVGDITKDVIVLQHFPGLTAETIVNVTGAGDTFVGYLLASLVRNPVAFQHPKTLSDTINAAQRAAILTLQSSQAVSPLLGHTRTVLD